MKIAIVGPLTFSSLSELEKHVTFKQDIVKKGMHLYPWIFNLAAGLLNIYGNEVHIITTSIYITKDEHFLYKGINFHILKAYPSLVNFPLFFVPDILKLKNYIRNIKPDIVHGQHRSFHSMSALLYSKKHVITNHGDIFEHTYAMFKSHKIFKRLFSPVFYRLVYFSFFQVIISFISRYIIAVSKSCIASSPFKNKHQLINNALNPVYFEYTWKRPDKHEILFVGTLTNLKRPILLLEYITQKKDVRLHIVTQLNNTDDYYKLLSDYIKQYNLQDKVTFSPYMSPSELAKTMSLSSVLCLPSTYESFGMVLAEAMAVGCPCVGSNVGGIPEVITDKKTGLLFNVNERADLFEKLDSIIYDYPYSLNISSSAKQEALKRWHPDKVALKTYELYKNIIENNHDSK